MTVHRVPWRLAFHRAPLARPVLDGWFCRLTVVSQLKVVVSVEVCFATQCWAILLLKAVTGRLLEKWWRVGGRKQIRARQKNRKTKLYKPTTSQKIQKTYSCTGERRRRRRRKKKKKKKKKHSYTTWGQNKLIRARQKFCIYWDLGNDLELQF